MAKSLTKEFGLLRSFFWPIHSYELKRFLPLFLMLFLICFNYGILRPLKDTLIITAAGAKILPYVKVWGILPIAILLTYFYTKLTSRFTQEKVFYIVTSSFLAFFLVFAFIMYPLREAFEPRNSALFFQKILPKGFCGFIDLYKHWTLTLFYVIAELWSSLVLSTLFWSVANEVTSVKESKRFYGVFGIASNLAALVSGFAANAMVIGSTWNQSIVIYITVVTLCGLVTMGIFRWQNKMVFSSQDYQTLHQVSYKKGEKKPSLKESLKMLSKSKYLISIAILLVSYNLAINLMDVIWKDRLHHLYPSPQAFNHYMNSVTSMIGLLSLSITFFIPKFIERFGWTKTALITPVAMMITGIGFFSFIFFGNSFKDLGFMAMTPLAIAVFFGGMQNCLSKSTKYSLFDSTKEMTFIPLDHKERFQSKAPIDVIGARLGKSGGAIIYQVLLFFFGSISACIPFVSVLFLGIMTFWISTTKNLGKMFNALVEKQTPTPEPGLETEMPASSS